LSELRTILKDETLDIADRVYLYEFTEADLQNFREVFDEFKGPLSVIMGQENLQQSLAIFGIPFPLTSEALEHQCRLSQQKGRFLSKLKMSPNQLTFEEFIVSVAAWRYHMVTKESFEEAYEIFVRSGASNLTEGAAKSIDERVLHTISKALGENIGESDWQTILRTCIKKSDPESTSSSFSKNDFVNYCLKEQETHFGAEMEKIEQWVEKDKNT
jgi:Ca2+-binding EF-hand superfamily protein